MKKIISILLSLIFLSIGFANSKSASFVYFSDLDDLGRVGPAYGRLGAEYPIGARASTQQITPTGWHSVYFDCVPGGWLFHRCHLIAHRFSDSEAVENIFTGTQALNAAMSAAEKKVAAYIQGTGNHVDYFVLPVYFGNNMLCSGVLVVARSVEDQSLRLLRWIPNVQEGVIIDYTQGEAVCEEPAA